MAVCMMIEKVLVTVATILSLSSSAMKKSVQIFVLAATANFLMGISYLFPGAYSGTAMAFVAALQVTVAAVYSAGGKDFPKKLKPLFFVLYSVCSVMNFKEVYDILPFIAAMFAMASGFQKSPQRIRVFCIANSVVWILYDIIVDAAALYSHSLYLAVNIVSLIWYSGKFRTINTDTNN